jgi:hypothetical protein
MPFVIEQSELPELVNNNESFFNVLLNLLPDFTHRPRRRARLYVDAVEIPIKSAEWSMAVGSPTGNLQIELADVNDRSAFTRTAEIKLDSEAYITGVWTVVKTYCNDAILATSNYNIENSGTTPNDSFSVTVKSVLSQKLDLSPVQMVVLYDPDKVDVDDTQLEVIPNLDGTETGSITVTPVASMTLQDVFDYIADLYGCLGAKTNINATQWVLTRVDFPAATPYWNTVAGIIGNHNPHIYIDSENYLVIKDGTLTDYLSARVMTIENFSGIRVNNTIERFKGTKLDRQLGSANWDFWEIRQEVNEQWFAGVVGQWPMTRETQYFQDFYKIGYDIPAWSQLFVNQQVEFINGYVPISATAEIYSYRYDQNGAQPTRTHSREWGIANVPTTYETFNVGLPSGAGDAIAAFGGDPSLYSATNVTEHSEAFVLTKDENTYYSRAPIFHSTNESYVSSTDTVTEALIVNDPEDQQLGQDFEQPYTKAQENGNLKDAGQDVRWGETDRRKEAQKAEKKKNVSLRTRRHSNLNSTNGLIAESYLDRRKGDVGDSDINIETKPVYITTNGDATASLWRSVNGGEEPLDSLIPLVERLNKKQTFPGGVDGDLPYYDETMDIGVVLDLQVDGREEVSLGIHKVTSYTDTMSNVADGGFQTKIQTEQIADSPTPEILSAAEDTFEVTLYASSATAIVEKLIACNDGHELSLETGAVAGCVVEVKEENEVSWWDIEAGAYDLSAFAGTTITMQFRFNPSAANVAQQLTFRYGPA